LTDRTGRRQAVGRLPGDCTASLPVNGPQAPVLPSTSINPSYCDHHVQQASRRRGASSLTLTVTPRSSPGLSVLSSLSGRLPRPCVYSRLAVVGGAPTATAAGTAEHTDGPRRAWLLYASLVVRPPLAPCTPPLLPDPRRAGGGGAPLAGCGRTGGATAAFLLTAKAAGSRRG